MDRTIQEALKETILDFTVLAALKGLIEERAELVRGVHRMYGKEIKQHDQ